MRTKKSERPRTIVERFTVRGDQSAVAMMVGLSKPGYALQSIKREGELAKVTFVKA